MFTGYSKSRNSSPAFRKVTYPFIRQLPRVSGITINIREHRRFRRTVNVMTIHVPLAKLVMKATFVPDGELFLTDPNISKRRLDRLQ